MALRLEAELLRLLDSRYVPVALDLVEGVGLGGLLVGRLFRVAETGILGGGMDSWLALACELESPCNWLVLLLDALRFQDKLSFRLSELMDEGVGGSSGLESGAGDFEVGCFVAIPLGAARGPDGLLCCGGG